MVVLVQRSRYTGNYEVLQHTRTMKRLTNPLWVAKTRSCYFNGSVRHSVECCCRSSKSQIDGSSSFWMLRNLPYKLSVGLGSVSVQMAGRTITGAFAVTPFSDEDNIPGVSRVA